MDAMVPLVRRLFRVDSELAKDVDAADVLKVTSPTTDSVCPVI